MTITLRAERITESDDVRPGAIADFGQDGRIVRFAIPDASKVVKNTREMQFAGGSEPRVMPMSHSEIEFAVRESPEGG